MKNLYLSEKSILSWKIQGCRRPAQKLRVFLARKKKESERSRNVAKKGPRVPKAKEHVLAQTGKFENLKQARPPSNLLTFNSFHSSCVVVFPESTSSSDMSTIDLSPDKVYLLISGCR